MQDNQCTAIGGNNPNGIIDSAMYEVDIQFAIPPTVRSVRFAEPIVVDVRERERTTECEKGTLFYSALEIREFRHEYRQYRRLNRNKMNDESNSINLSPLNYFKSDEALLISGFIHGAFTFASDQVNTLQKTVKTNLVEVLNAVAESETNDNIMYNSDLSYLIETY